MKRVSEIVGKVLLDIKENQIKWKTLIIEEENCFYFPETDYWITKSDIKTHKDILHWLSRLSRKRWFDLDKYQQMFISKCENYLDEKQLV